MLEIEVSHNNQEALHSKYYSIFLVVFSSLWLASTLVAIKTVSFFGITLTGGFFIFPIVSYLNCLINDVYGYKNSRQGIWSIIIMGILYLFCINLVYLLPSSPQWKLESAFQSILIPQNRLVIASIISFWISGFINNYFMTKLKNKGIGLLLRIFISSMISLTIDLTLYFSIGFIGAISILALKKIFIFAYIKKIIFEILLLPIVWPIIDFVKKKEGFEIYDTDTKFTPFSLDNVYKISDFKKINTVKISKKN